jgi:hypothetical protein
MSNTLFSPLCNTHHYYSIIQLSRDRTGTFRNGLWYTLQSSEESTIYSYVIRFLVTSQRENRKFKGVEIKASRYEEGLYTTA